MSNASTVIRPARYTKNDCRVADLVEVVEQGQANTETDAYPLAADFADGVPLYRADELRAADPDEARAELARVFADGPGIAVLTGALDAGPLDATTAAFRDLIDDQRRAGRAVGDHFAAPGANDRVWNALEKLAVAHPDAFVDYYANDLIALAATAWLGSGYQVTSQVNVVNPGGQRQEVHRDYHLGFLSDDTAAAYPAHVHHLSPALTLQGAVAHVDMPVESGPTLYLPHSQKYAPGYLAWRLPEFRDHFDAHHVQLPLRAGDAVFFNPALFHAAGTNHSADISRMANLLQISSAFGRSMEAVDRTRVALAVYPALLEGVVGGRLDDAAADRVIAASAEGYAFPTNLDLDPPVDGLSPATQADRMRTALRRRSPVSELADELARHDSARTTT